MIVEYDYYEKRGRESSLRLQKFKLYCIYFLTIFSVFFSLFDILPDILTDASKLIKINGVLKNTELIENGNSKKNNDKTLNLIMTNNDFYQLTVYKSHLWSELQNENNIGKEFTLYFKNRMNVSKNPLKIEINHKIIYDHFKDLNSEYFYLIFTFFATLYSIYNIRKAYLKNN